MEPELIKKKSNGKYYIFGFLIFFIVVFFIVNYTINGKEKLSDLLEQSYSKLISNNEFAFSNLYSKTDDIAYTRDDNYFDFDIEGINRSNKKLYYEIKLSDGNDLFDRIRINSNDLKISLFEIIGDKEVLLINKESYDDFNNRTIYVDTINELTDDLVNRTYRIRMWSINNLLDYNKLFASIKISISSSFEEKHINVPSSCFNYLNTDNEMTLVGYDYNCGTDVYIPNKIDGYYVKTISQAFDNSSLTMIVVPSNVINIVNNAFYGYKGEVIINKTCDDIKMMENYPWNFKGAIKDINREVCAR